MAEQQGPLEKLPGRTEGDSVPSADLAKEIRKLSHDLSNALEIVVQTSYLLGTVELKDPATDWLRMLNDGVNRALELNNALRMYIREHTNS